MTQPAGTGTVTNAAATASVHSNTDDDFSFSEISTRRDRAQGGTPSAPLPRIRVQEPAPTNT